MLFIMLQILAFLIVIGVMLTFVIDALGIGGIIFVIAIGILSMFKK